MTMPFHRLRRLIQGQGGSTLVELLVAMPIAVLLLGMTIEALGRSGHQQQDIERRTEAITQGQLGLDRMTRDVRSAGWIYFRSSSVVDIDAQIRYGADGISSHKLVRYDCSTDVCTRSEGPATTYPPPASPTFTGSVNVIGGDSSNPQERYGRITGHDIFRPTHVDPTTGARTPEFTDPDFLSISIQMAVEGRVNPVQLDDGIAIRNKTNFKG